MESFFWKIKNRLLRNHKTISNFKFEKHSFYIESFCLDNGSYNLGDTLAEPIIEFLLKKYNLKCKKFILPKHLLSVGSVIGIENFNATIWGSGLISQDMAKYMVLKKYPKYVKYDIRSVRGPLTKATMEKMGYNCPEVYGAPAIILPLIFNPCVKKKYEISYIAHYNDKTKTNIKMHLINIQTKDYRQFIKEVKASKMIISSSLHGIIIAETYGVPCVWLKKPFLDEFKYHDWYMSTQRKISNICCASTIKEALLIKVKKPPVKKIEKMRNEIINSFPYDLFIKNKKSKMK